MDKTNKNDSKTIKYDTHGNFLLAYQMLPSILQPKLRDELIAKCYWGGKTKNFTNTFYGKMRGAYKITELERPIIEKVFLDYNLNAWTGEYINSVKTFNQLANV